ncbi:hypothetical protein HanRHA438_Chr16g0762921 [Helianthus annuus]|uniref:Uncharacterized protein n=1 Tax=Helianthus annuus TaxID=4232 RepID=A0A9K3GY14_HELAN|nr:hypothetical protein HanXRQr2_Chr16g0751141 [Helianthus annuus]KAJ0443031.1 hypothetical protein HanIR_Chr16g0816141 [Helianthus annuus]KAJ0641056.1 hypothetical protein HanLR1_Chr16g0622801 [Helianthus annuus]KAJ0644978.1 hypothetical protein HanOQP8_Chr16g0618571 [Helianthus annuus]KAJ0821408.1 hypothetical protein HanPSC8_Chr16g0719841 [Helianthus annuus]
MCAPIRGNWELLTELAKSCHIGIKMDFIRYLDVICCQTRRC